MKAIIKKPGEKSKVIEIENELSVLQEAVEGYIQAVPLAADVCIICNEEGKLIGLPYNTRIMNEIFVGNILFVGVAGEMCIRDRTSGSDDIAYSIHFKVFQETQEDKK